MESPIREAIAPVSRRKGKGKEESLSVRIDIVSEDECSDQLVSSSILEDRAPPEKKLALFAVVLALLEKAANGIGAMNFIWATVVLLGGFAQTLESIDFWFVSIILMAEGVRLFARSSELETEEARRRASASDFEIFFGFMDFFTIAVQDWFPLACVIMSSYRLSRQHYGGKDYPNRNRALNIFYGLSLGEEFLMLLVFSVRVLSTLKIFEFLMMTLQSHLPVYTAELYQKTFGYLPSNVNREYGFDKSQLPTVRRFLSDTYSRCINGSVSDGLNMEFVSYSLELLQSSASDHRLTGARLISALMKSDRFAVERLKEIGTMRGVLERLIEILKWDELQEQEIRVTTAEIISKLVMIDQISIRVMAIPESMESIASLLYDSYQIEIHSRKYPDQSLDEYIYSVSSLMGLRILKTVANDQEICAKIGRNRGLLRKIIGLTELNTNASEWQIPKHLKTVANDQEICAKIGRNRAILSKIIGLTELNTNASEWQIPKHLKMLAIDTLTTLAREPEVRESIGGTGGVLRNLFSLFFMKTNNYDEKKLVTKAGEALDSLSVENKFNCELIMSTKLGDRPNLIESLISLLDDPMRGIHVARVLRNLLAYTEADRVELREITATAEKVLELVMKKQGADQEAAIGLAAQIFKFMRKLDFDPFKEQRAQIRSLISKLVEVFEKNPIPSMEVPSIRRFSIELLIAVMEMESSTIEMTSEWEEDLDGKMIPKLEEALVGVIKTTSELENCITFPGAVLLSGHRMDVRSLADSAIMLLRRR